MGGVQDCGAYFRTIPMCRRRLLIGAAVTMLWLLASCGTRPQETTLRYAVRGKVISVDKDARRVTVAHEEIPGFMAAMTMPFAIRDEWPFRVLAPGQEISATLVVEAGRSWLEEITVVQQAPAGASAPVAASTLPDPGAEVPDFVLTNQEGKHIRLHQYRGTALLLTFIYTRCPLPDFCPRMSGNFAQIHRAMRNDADLRHRLHLLTVSFDPEHDTAEVLRGYGRGFIGEVGPDAFRDWEFASGSGEEVKAITRYFGLDYWPEKGQIVHSLRTALIGPDGRLVRLYQGNEWTPADVLRDLKTAGSAGPTQP